MKTEINYYTFRNWFKTNRPDNFSDNGLLALWEMFEEYEQGTGEEFEFDPIAFCCEYNEYDNIAEFHKEYDSEEYPDIESIENNTMIWEFGTESFIMQIF
tara:strand:- start:65 stop:364 length:300 start_codon:yes stop_codon:yes gene_type:complete